MVLEVKSICCVESLRKIPEIFGLEKGKSMFSVFSRHSTPVTYNLLKSMMMK